jgi:hypothetical protein
MGTAHPASDVDDHHDYHSGRNCGRGRAHVLRISFALHGHGACDQNKQKGAPSLGK